MRAKVDKQRHMHNKDENLTTLLKKAWTIAEVWDSARSNMHIQPKVDEPTVAIPSEHDEKPVWLENEDNNKLNSMRSIEKTKQECQLQESMPTVAASKQVDKCKTNQQNYNEDRIVPTEANADSLMKTKEIKEEKKTAKIMKIGTTKGNAGQLMTIRGKISGYSAKILVDSGATDMFISRKWMQDKDLNIVELTNTIKIELADGKTTESITRKVEACVQIGDFESLEKLHEVTLGRHDAILGVRWLEKHNPIINWREKMMTIQKSNEEYRVNMHSDEDAGQSAEMNYGLITAK